MLFNFITHTFHNNKSKGSPFAEVKCLFGRVVVLPCVHFGGHVTTPIAHWLDSHCKPRWGSVIIQLQLTFLWQIFYLFDLFMLLYFMLIHILILYALENIFYYILFVSFVLTFFVFQRRIVGMLFVLSVLRGN